MDYNHGLSIMQEPQFQHYEQIVTTECHGEDPNNTLYENDMHFFVIP